jgi:UDP-2,3-diacylglucosamine pyrophosphatase LpxH
MHKKLSRNEKIKVRSVWISDVHLGFRGCSAEYLLDFLHQVECDYLYLVGDIIDVWEMKKKNVLAPTA